MSEEKVQIFINKKEMPYSHQNMIRAINSFFPYLTNDDLHELEQDILDLITHRKEKQKQVEEECKNIPIQTNRHDT